MTHRIVSCYMSSHCFFSLYFALLLDDFIYRNSKLSNSLICQPSVKEIVVLALLFVLKDKGLFIFHQSVKAFRDTSTNGVCARLLISGAAHLLRQYTGPWQADEGENRCSSWGTTVAWTTCCDPPFLYHILLVSHFVHTHQFAQHDCHLHIISDYI